MIRLTRQEARRIAVRGQLLEARRPTDLISMVQQLTFLPVDPTNAIAPAVDLLSWSRMGRAYWPGAVDDAITDRMLYQLVGTVRSMADLPLYLAEMAVWPPPEQNHGQRWLEANDAFRRDVLARIAAQGPLLSREIPDTAAVPWESSGWTGNRSVNLMLELLSVRGLVAISGRVKRERLWDLAERVYPPMEAVPLEEARAERARRRMQALGISRPKIMANAAGEGWYAFPAGKPAEVEGVDGAWVVDPDAVAALDEFKPRTALISPFDRLVHDPARRTDLFDFDYVLEMYKPAAKRRWGYFALPILHGERFVGKVDATADRKAGVLRVTAIHEDLPFSAEVGDAVDAELADLARWLHLDLDR